MKEEINKETEILKKKINISTGMKNINKNMSIKLKMYEYE